MSFDAKARAKETKRLHEQVRSKIKEVNEQCKLKANKNRTHLEFKHRDLVSLHLKKERLSSSRKNKLMTRGGGLNKVVQKVQESANKIELPEDVQISSTFNIRDLTPYLEDDEKHNEDLRSNLLQGERLTRSKLLDWTFTLPSKDIEPSMLKC